MKAKIAKEMAILWSDFEDFDVEAKLDAFHRLNKLATVHDLPQLLDALASSNSDWWIRELLAEPISVLGGANYLQPLFDALQKNFDDGHDNDTFCHFLVAMATAEPGPCKLELERLKADPEFKYREHAQWLLEFCE